MKPVKAVLEPLLLAPGPSGHEAPVRAVIERQWRPLADRVSYTRLGSLHALRRGHARAPRPSLMIAAHMDTVGLTVSGIADEFLEIAAIGSVEAGSLPGMAVVVHGRKDLPGVVAIRDSRGWPGPTTRFADAMAGLVVDTGVRPGALKRSVRVGDLVSLVSEPFDLGGDLISGSGLDNRVSIAALTLCLEELSELPHACDLWAVATTQEETSFAGAATSAYLLRPSMAITLDTTYGKGPGAGGWDCFELGRGPTLAIGPNMHPGLHARLRQIAEEMNIPYSVEPVPASSESDGMALQVAGAGIPTMFVGLPIRNMHTAVEVAALADIEGAARLLAGFVASLEPGFVDTLTWDL